MDMVALKQFKVMEIMEQIGGMEVEEMVTCADCNVSVTPSNIQATADKSISTQQLNCFCRCMIRPTTQRGEV